MRYSTSLVAALLASSALGTAAVAHDDGPRTELFKPGVAHAEAAVPAADAQSAAYASALDAFAMPVHTDSEEARALFEQGVGQLWGFNHAAAIGLFRAAQVADPGCALCYWGEAYALGPNLNDGMHPENEAAAVEAARRAFGASVTPKERMLTAAVVARYAPDGGDRTALDQAFADEMARAVEQFPDDPNVLVIRADALMNLQPWDYWEADGVTPKGNGAEILAVLERALELAPDHPAALHLYIHAVEASADPARAEAAADRLRGAVPMAGHLVHMPAHIYNRIGRFADSIEVNKAAIAADEAYLAAAGDAASPLYRFGYYPHNLHFLLVGAQMAGLRDEALSAAAKLSAVTSDEVSRDLAWVQAIKTAPYSAHAQFSDPATILALPDPGDAFPFVKAHWHYARGTALALQGNLDAAQDAQYAIERILAEADLSGLEEQYLPARDVLGIAKHLVEARIAQANEDWDAAVHHAEAAVALQDGIAYMEPPYWSYPVRQTLGAIRLQQGRTGMAVVTFEEALTEAPNNGWALWGLWQALKADAADQGDTGEVNAARRAFGRAWLGDQATLSVERL